MRFGPAAVCHLYSKTFFYICFAYLHQYSPTQMGFIFPKGFANNVRMMIISKMHVTCRYARCPNIRKFLHVQSNCNFFFTKCRQGIYQEDVCESKISETSTL